jgi:transposase InsO family protein
VIYAFIKDSLQQYPVQTACRVLQVSRGGYYAWRDRPASPSELRRQQLAGQIQAIHQENRKVYGSPRMYQALKAQGERVCQNTVAKVMAQQGIRAKTHKKFIPRTTDSRHEHPVAGNLLERNFKADAPDQKWVVDITYVPTDEGWLYLAGMLDLCSRRIVGWSMAKHLQSELVEDALKMALSRRNPAQGLLHHSDRGVQYVAEDYQQLLLASGMIGSMSRKGDCWDNAVMESFWGTLKSELVNHQQYATRAEARQSIFEYIEVFYNRKRLHSALGYQSPEAFEAAFN